MQNFDEYLRQGEPNRAEKAKVWKTAIGLQQVDGLKPSEYLIATAKQNIEGYISIFAIVGVFTNDSDGSLLVKTPTKAGSV